MSDKPRDGVYGDYDWKLAAQTLAADNARLCSIAIAADALAEAAAKSSAPAIRDALDAYKVVRNGH